MSLTGHLRDSASPVRAWFAARLPYTRRVATDANRALLEGRRDPVYPRVNGSSPVIVGIGVDYLVRLLVDPATLPFNAAATGEKLLAGLGYSDLDQVPAIEARLRELAPWRHPLEPKERRELLSLCLVLAHLETCYRAPVAALFVVERLRDTVLHGLRQTTLRRRLVDALVPPTDLADLERLYPAAEALARSVNRPRHLNPEFTQSVALGGADADIICGDLLIDVKSTDLRGIVSRFVLWQLVGYLLADTDDAYRIRRLGVCAIRWGSRVTWEVDDLLRELAGETRPLEAWRDEFATMLGGPVRRNTRPATTVVASPSRQAGGGHPPQGEQVSRRTTQQTRPSDDEIVRQVVDVIAGEDGQLGLRDVELRLRHLPHTRVRQMTLECERLGYLRRTGVKRSTRLWLG